MIGFLISLVPLLHPYAEHLTETIVYGALMDLPRPPETRSSWAPLRLEPWAPSQLRPVPLMEAPQASVMSTSGRVGTRERNGGPFISFMSLPSSTSFSAIFMGFNYYIFN